MDKVTRIDELKSQIAKLEDARSIAQGEVMGYTDDGDSRQWDAREDDLRLFQEIETLKKELAALEATPSS